MATTKKKTTARKPAPAGSQVAKLSGKEKPSLPDRAKKRSLMMR